MADGHSGSVRQCLRQDRSCSGTGGRGGHAGRTPTMLTSLEAAVACGSSGSGPASGRAPHELPCPRWLPQGPLRVHAGGRRAVGGRTPVRASDRRGHRHGHRHQPGHVCRTPAVRTAVVPEAADGQSADRSGSLQLPLLFLKAGLRAAASGRPRPAASRLLPAPEPSHASKKANRSALMVSACVVGMPCGKPL